MKKPIKIFFIVVIILFFASWIWTFLVSSNYLLLGGSTSCNEFMQEATKKYKTQEVIYSSVGSQAGINGAVNKSFAAGFVSKNETEIGGYKNKKVISNKPKKEDMKNTKYKFISLSFAKDAVEVVYNPPKWWNENKLDEILSLNKNDLKMIYSNNLTWEGLAKEQITNSNQNISDYKIPNSNTLFISYTRESGSGTKDAFSEKIGMSEFKFSNVANSNGVMISNIEEAKNSIGYISYAFNSKINKTSNIIEAGIEGWKLGNDQLGDSTHAWKYDKKEKKYIIVQHKTNEEAIKSDSGYDLTRPFLMFYNTNLKSNVLNSLINFINYIVGDDSNKVFSDTGLVKSIELEGWS